MNKPIVLAQLSNSQPVTGAPPRTLKLEKPANGAAITVHLDGNTRLDFLDLTNEKITFVRVGDRLVVLFDNQSTVTIDPVFNGVTGEPLPNVSFEMGPDRVLNGTEFAALFPVTTDQSVLPAAGSTSGTGSGAHFVDPSVDPLGATGTPLALLGNEAGGATSFSQVNPGFPVPILGTADVALLDDEGLPGGIPGGPGDVAGQATTVTGSLHIDFGGDTSGRQILFAADQPGLAGLTSGGEAVHILVTTIGGVQTIIGYVGNDANVAANQVFTITLSTDSLEGSYTVTLLRPLDHPVHGTEDTIDLTVAFTAVSGHGNTASGTFHVDVNDDTPTIDQTAVGHSTLTDPATLTPVTSTGSLGISWGADRFNAHVDGGISATNGHNGDRSVVFSDAGVTVTGHAGDATSNVATLTSNGNTVHYVLLDNGTTLVGYTGDVAPTSAPTGGEAPSNIVFVVTLSDASDAGSYTVTQYQPLDHVAGGTTFQSIDLGFHFTATDSDGDSVNGSLSVTINDTVPVTTGPIADHTLAESASGEGGAFVSATTGDVALNIDWGADRADPNTGAIDRTVTFASTTIADLTALHLHSNGVELTYVILTTPAGATLVALAGETQVFTVVLSDANSGSYNFTLLGPLDHPTGEGRNDEPLTFNVVAKDSDGDTVGTSFTVHVTDDVPTLAGKVSDSSVGEDGLSGGNGSLGADTAASNVVLNVNWGADSDTRHTGDTYGRTLSFLSGGESPTAIGGGTGPVESLGLIVTGANGNVLSSGGVALTYVVTALDNGGELLTAYKGSPSDGNAVFTLTLDPTSAHGSYSFQLLGTLDDAANSNTINLTFKVQAADADGDTVNTSFTVNVQDDVPVISGKVSDSSVGEDGLSGGNGTLGADTAASNVALNVNWGADSDTRHTGDTYGRTLSFLSGGESPTAIGGGTGTVESLGLIVTGANGNVLSSGGVALTYVVTALDNGGELLTAYKGSPSDGNAVFTLTLDPTSAHGSYSFQLLGTLDDAANSNTINLTFNVQAVDADGDTVNTSFTVNVQDDVPVISGKVSDSTVGEDGLAGGNGSLGADTAASNVALNVNWGADSDTRHTGDTYGRTLSFLSGGESPTAIAGGTGPVESLGLIVTGANGNVLSSGGVALTYVVTALDNGGELLTAYKGSPSDGNAVFTLTLDPTSAHGSYSFQLLGTLDDAANSNTINLTFKVQAADADGDTVNTSFTVNVQDDVPVISGKVSDATVGEDGLSGANKTGGSYDAADNASISNVALNINWGADSDTHTGAGDTFGRTLSFLSGGESPSAIAGGEGAVASLGLSVTGAAGSALSSGGVALTYVVTALDNGGELLTAYKGSPSDGIKIFTLTLDPTSAHGSYSFQLLGPLDDAANSNAIGLTFKVQAADADGDTVNTSFTVNVQDDVPVANGATDSTIREGHLPAGNEGSDPSLLTATASLGVSWGADNGPARSLAFNTTTVGPLQFPDVTIKDASGTFLGTSKGDLLIYTVSTTADGHPLLTATAYGLNGAPRTVFTIELDPSAPNGAYKFTLLDALDERPGSGNNSLDIQVGFKATDSDGDTVSSKLTVHVVDDVPVAGKPDTVTLYEQDLPTVTGAADPTPADVTSLSGSVGISWGADNDTNFPGERQLAFAMSGLNPVVTVTDSVTGAVANLTSGGQAVHYLVVPLLNGGSQLIAYTGSVFGAGNPANQVFTLTLDPDATANGQYTFQLLGKLDHTGAGADTLSFNFKVNATDSDGDTVSTNILVNVVDNVPATPDGATLSVDEHGLVNGTDIVAVGHVSALSVGADGYFGGSLAKAITFTTLPTGLTIDNGTAVVVTQNGNVVTGKAGNVTVFTLTIAADGTYTYDQKVPLFHTGAGADVKQIDFAFTIKDGDGDVSQPATVSVKITDDVPANPAGATLSVNEHGLVGAADIVAVSTTAPLSAGADGFYGGSLATAINFTALPAGLTIDNGTAVVVTQNGNVVTGMAGGVTVFTLTIAQDGTYTYDQKVPLFHSGTGADVKELDFTFTIKDADGDVSQGATVAVKVTDDVPTIAVSSATIVADETPGAQNGTNDVSTAAPALLAAAGTIINLAQSAAGYAAISGGADGVKSVALTTSAGAALVNVDSGLTTLDGTHILLSNDASNANLVLGKANGVTVLAIFVDPATGTVSVAEYGAIKHPDGSNPNDAVSLANVVYVSVTDGDNDVATSATPLHINILDDGPTIATPVATTVGESDLTTHATTTSHGSLGINFGTDGAAAPGAPVNSGATQTFTFDNFPNGALAYVTLGDFKFTTDQGVANVTGHAGQLYGTLVTISDTAGPFTLSKLDLGLYGTSNGATYDNITLTGYDASGHVIATLVVNVGPTVGLGSPLSTIDLSHTVFDGLQISKLTIVPQHDNNVNGSVVVDNVVVNSGASPATPNAVTFSSTSAIANVHIVDDQGNAVDASTLTSQGQAVHYALIDGATLVAYTGASAPTSISGANVVFSVVLSQNAANPNGAYDFTLSKPLDDLPRGAVTDLKFTFDFTGKDGDGDTVPGHFTVTVHDDTPTAHDVSTSMSENDTKVITLTAGTDYAFGADSQGAAITLGTATLTGAPAGVTLGMPAIALGADGHTITITPGTAFDGLNAGQQVTLHIPYTVTDGDGDTVTKDIAVVVNGVNDPAVISGTVTGSVTEAGGVNNADNPNQIATGTLTAADVDNPANTFQAVGWTNTTYGSYTVDSSGHWTYGVNNSNATVAGLNIGDKLTDTFTVLSADGTPQVITITINGANDAPTTSPGFPDGGTMTEYAATNPNAGSSTDRTYFDSGYNGGGFHIADTDFNDAHTVAVSLQSTTAPSVIGYIDASIGTDTGTTGYGFVNWNYHVTDAQLNPLAEGQIVTEVFRITVTDSHGASTYRDITITLVGSNDAPTVVGASTSATGTLAELPNATGAEATDHVSGTIAFADPDLIDTHAATAGDPTFVWSGGSLSSDQVAALKAASLLNLVVSDAVTPGHGNVAWTYNVTDGALDFLANGQTLTVTYNVTIDDHHGGTVVQPVTVTITGANDAPVITSGASGTEAEGTAPSNVVYQITATDADAGSHLTYSLSGADAGAFSVSSTGAVTFNAPPNYETKNVYNIIVHANDGIADTTKAVTINVTNVAPVAAGESYTVAEDTLLTTTAATGVLANDTDAGGGPLNAVLVSGPSHASSFHLNADGSFTYQAAADYAGGDSFTYKANDGTADSNVVTVNLVVTPVSDGPATLTITDSTPSTPPTVGDVLQANLGHDRDGDPAAGTVTYQWMRDGQAILNATGTTYTLTNSDIGKHITVTAHYIDGQGFTNDPVSDPTVAVVSNNVAPTVTSGTFAGAVTEDAGTPTGPELVTDGNMEGAWIQGVPSGWTAARPGYVTGSMYGVHSGSFSTIFYAYDSSNPAATLSQNITTVAGQSYLIDFWAKDVNGLGVISVVWNGQTVAAYGVSGPNALGTSYHEYQVVVNGTGGSTSLTFAGSTAGTNTGDQIYLDDVSVKATTPNTTQTTSGTVHFSDDPTDTHLVTVTPQGSGYLGTLSVGTIDEVNQQFNWNFSVANAALQFLAAGQTLTQTYNLAIDDQHGHITNQTVTVTLNGVNDAPVFDGGTTTGAVNKIATTSSLLANGDFETGALGPWTSSATSTTGGSPYAAVGSVFSFYNGDHYNYEVGSNTAATLSQTVHTVAGQSYLLEFDLAGSYGLAGNSSVNVLWNNTSQGVLTNLGNAVGHYQYLLAGDGGTDTVALQIVSNGQLGNIDVNDVKLTPAEVAKGSISFHDVDLTDTVHTVSVSPNGSNYYGTLTASVDDTNHLVNWTFVVKDSDLSGLAYGQHVDQTYTLLLDDGHGGTVSQNVTVTVTAPADSQPAVAGTITTDASNGSDFYIPTAAILWNMNHAPTGDLAITSVGGGNSSSQIFLTTLSDGETYVHYHMTGSSQGFDYTLSNGTSAHININQVNAGGLLPGGTSGSDFYVETYGNGVNMYGGGGSDIVVAAGVGNASNLYGDAQQQGDTSGSAGNDLIFGSQFADNIYGGAGNDALYGGAGNDKLYGENGDDVLVGGLGNDTLTGGLGADTFVFKELGTSNKDTITDYNRGSGTYNANEGDKIDISGLLDSIFNQGANAGNTNVANYVQAISSGGNTTLQVDLTGGTGANHGTHNWQDVATLTGVSAGNILNVVFDHAQQHQVTAHT